MCIRDSAGSSSAFYGGITDSVACFLDAGGPGNVGRNQYQFCDSQYTQTRRGFSVVVTLSYMKNKVLTTVLV